MKFKGGTEVKFDENGTPHEFERLTR